ncbi:DUF4007 family protein [Vibrio parahaemolyticus]|uniref:DUF4007 family protein n=2 Tax=Vibrio parahaemolyticus TaxID=670 RepID=UPI0015DF1324|nr:DUF4007 family protein [Vibrio parahaemolyticus]ELA9593019.1 DUF4007 family protein [Vibrio parahaemolyticus]MCI9699133.1 DUF4007 family protein [Vibrio parahaemolyticus]MCR9813056.1 DUF4007 family protein [Vibrio parahaemolyticus]MDF4379140.1 DUF4007 family protein [Vibrio parahaemolyticus]MDF4388510.1 DUF4007 family protein [Vibrio parahaemolyticus]
MNKYTARFSGHQTFPLRYGWLYKYFQTSLLQGFDTLTTEDLMVEWGVGKNMVDAIKYWAGRVGIYEQADTIKVSDEYFEIERHDQHLESMSSLWMIHWLLCRNVSELTSYRIFFNFYNGLKVDKESLLGFIKDLFEKNQFKSDTKSENILQLPTDNSLYKDIGTFFLTYAKSKSSKVSEDSFSSPLSELGLLKQFDKQIFLCELEQRHSLSNEVFTYAVIDYFLALASEKNAVTMSFESFMSEPGSPARIFRMSQFEVENRLEIVSELTSGKIGWTDTQGLRQIQIKDSSVLKNKKHFLKKIYK